MSEIIYKTIFKLKRGNSKTLALKNIILAEGEPCYEVDTNKLKIGNGKQQYNDLPYIVDLSSFLMKEQYAQDLILLDELVTDLQNQISNNTEDIILQIDKNKQVDKVLEQQSQQIKTLNENVQNNLEYTRYVLDEHSDFINLQRNKNDEIDTALSGHETWLTEQNDEIKNLQGEMQSKLDSTSYDALDEKISNNTQKIKTLEEEKANSADIETLSKAIQELTKEAIELPKVTTMDEGRFLRVSDTGKWEAQFLKIAEEVAY